MTEESFVSIDALAKHFSVSVSTVRGWVRYSLVPFLKVGGVYRFKISEVEQALRAISSSTQEPPLPSGTQLAFNFDPSEDL
jgi:excisionase family DNA binding protein